MSLKFPLTHPTLHPQCVAKPRLVEKIFSQNWHPSLQKWKKFFSKDMDIVIGSQSIIKIIGPTVLFVDSSPHPAFWGGGHCLHYNMQVFTGLRTCTHTHTFYLFMYPFIWKWASWLNHMLWSTASLSSKNFLKPVEHSYFLVFWNISYWQSIMLPVASNLLIDLFIVDLLLCFPALKFHLEFMLNCDNASSLVKSIG